MNRPRPTTTLRAALALGCALALAPRARAEGYSNTSPIPPEAIAKIEAAAPAEAPAKPKAKRRLLVFAPPDAYHASVPYSARAIELMGRKTGAFEATLSDDISVFEPESLAKFDGIFMNSVTPVNKLPKELFLPGYGEKFAERPEAERAAAKAKDERLKKSVMDFVRGGKGICANHSTTDCFYEWREFGEMIGGYFNQHPWLANEKVTLKIDDPASPVAKPLGAGPFEIGDEIYQFQDPYSRKALHILASLDTTKTNMTKPAIKRTDGDFAVSWIRNWGKGRVFYTSLGHREDIYFNPVVMKHYLAGIQFALGDLEADAQPKP